MTRRLLLVVLLVLLFSPQARAASNLPTNDSFPAAGAKAPPDAAAQPSNPLQLAPEPTKSVYDPLAKDHPAPVFLTCRSDCYHAKNWCIIGCNNNQQCIDDCYSAEAYCLAAC
jgi:hypothetical protein